MGSAVMAKPGDRIRMVVQSIETATQRVIGVVLLLTVLLVVIRPREPNNPTNPLIVVVGLALACAGFVFAARRFGIRPAPWSAKRGNRLGWTLCGATTALAWLTAYTSVYETTWDSRLVQLASALPPDEFSEYYVAYFSRYPNNYAMLAVARIARGMGAIGLNYDAAFALINAACYLAAAVAMYIVVRQIRGAKAGALSLVFLLGVLGLSPWMSVPYTDVLAMWTPIVALALFLPVLRGPTIRGVVGALAGGAVLAVGFVLKVTPVVGMVAVVAVGVLAFASPGSRRRHARRAVATSLIAAALGFGAGYVGFSAWASSSADMPPLTPGVSKVPLSYVADGIREQYRDDGSVVYGGYDRVVNLATWGRPTDEQTETSRELIGEQVSTRGFAGMVGFAIDKWTFNFGDGTFWARGEGQDMAKPLLASFPWRAVGAANDPAVPLWGIHVHLAEILWLFILTVSGAGLLVCPPRRDILLAAVTLLGAGLFMLVFQGRSRYLIPHLPVFCAVAAIGAATVWRRLAPRLGRRAILPG
ncbi:hypothetical protein [Propionicicella superfundia]|uniref:hypothetical protein n=1 Tax=Propionicicella superfundia TaxID=348582 RepID=UPI0012EB759D|nr:hypothetical protein [Propionicicella superfundia]